MKIESVLFLAGLALLSGCNGNAPQQQNPVTPVSEPAVSEAGNALSDNDSEGTYVDPSNDEVALGKIMALLVKENIGGPGYQKLWESQAGLASSASSNFISFHGWADENDESTLVDCNVGAFRNPNGTYLVLVFSKINRGEAQCSSYLYNGSKLEAFSVKLPKPKYADFLDGTCLFGITDKGVLGKVKSGVVERPSYSCSDDTNFRVYADLQKELGSEEEGFSFGSVEYGWNGSDFVKNPNQPKEVLGQNGIGNLKVGGQYKGEPIDGYEVKGADASYECWKNGTKCFTINTEGGSIESFDVFSSQYSFDPVIGGDHVGMNLNAAYKNLTDIERIEKDGDVWTIVLDEGRHYVNATDVVDVKETNGKIEKIVFKNDATLKGFRLVASEEELGD